MSLKHILKTLGITTVVFLIGILPKAYAFCNFFCELPNQGGSQGTTLENNLVSLALIAGVGIFGYRIFRSRNEDKKT